MKLCLVTSRIPPARCGIGDYTWRLAEEFGKRHEVYIVTSAGQSPPETPDGVRVLSVVPGWGVRGAVALFRMLKRLEPDWIDLQYVPFLYSRRGVNFALPFAVIALRTAGARVLLTVHEPFVPLQRSRMLVFAVLQRLQLFLLVLGCRKVSGSVARWRDILRRWFPWRREDISWLPVGSNVPRVAIDDEEREKVRIALGIHQTDVVLALMNPLGGSGKCLEDVVAVWTEIRSRRASAKLLITGADRVEATGAAADLAQDPRVIWTGYLEHQDLSRTLSAADVFVCPFSDGVSTRRGSAIAAMEHGLPIVTTVGASTDASVFDGSPIVGVAVGDRRALRDAIERLIDTPDFRRLVAGQTRRFFAEHFRWDFLASRILA